MFRHSSPVWKKGMRKAVLRTTNSIPFVTGKKTLNNKNVTNGVVATASMQHSSARPLSAATTSVFITRRVEWAGSYQQQRDSARMGRARVHIKRIHHCHRLHAHLRSLLGPNPRSWTKSFYPSRAERASLLFIYAARLTIGSGKASDSRRTAPRTAAVPRH